MQNLFQDIFFYLIGIFFVVFGTFKLLSSSFNLLSTKDLKNSQLLIFLVLFIIQIPVFSFNFLFFLSSNYQIVINNIIGINVILSILSIFIISFKNPFQIINQSLRKDSLILLVLNLLLFLFLIDKSISKLESIFLLILLSTYLIYKFKFNNEIEQTDKILKIFSSKTKSKKVNILTVLLSILLIILFTNYFFMAISNLSITSNISLNILSLIICPFTYSIVMFVKANKCAELKEQNFFISLLINFNIFNLLFNLSIIGLFKNLNFEELKFSELSLLVVLSIAFYITTKQTTVFKRKDLLIFFIVLLIYIFMVLIKL